MELSRKKKIALGMSGGVDSSLAAHLLVEAGYDVTGVYLECWRAPGCRTDQDRKDALTVALQLNIPYLVLDFKEEYKQRVVEYFFAEYEAGRTPNPDVMCNKEIKFGMFYEWAVKHDFDAIATGHYAQIGEVAHSDGATPSHCLVSSTDTWKDQTYFLYRMTEEHLAHTLFPIGHLTKKDVRALAQKKQLPVADKKDSVGICFIGDIDVHQFLKERLGEKIGDVIDTKGRVIGQHKGLWFYTIGQRHGFTIYPKTVTLTSTGETLDHHNIPPFYVIGKNADQNQLIVGFGRETYQQQFQVADLHWTTASLTPVLQQHDHLDLTVRIRHTGQLHRCSLDLKQMQVTLEQPIQGLAEGQSAVFYVSASNLPREYSLKLPTAQDQSEALLCLGGAVIVNPK